MRRFPVHFLIDVSESMVGEELEAVEKGLSMFQQAIRSNPFALETLHVSVSVFAGKAQTLTPLTQFLQFTPPKLPIGGGTALGAALDHLMTTLDTTTQRTNAEVKGDWIPLVLLFTDGAPTDSPDKAIQRWKTSYKDRKAKLVAISIGKYANVQQLQEITDHVLLMENATKDAFAGLFEWVSASVASHSEGLNQNKQEFDFDRIEDSVAKKVDKAEKVPTVIDDRFVILLGRCQSKKKLYLMKFRNSGKGKYDAEGGYPITESYLELSGGTVNQSVNVDKLTSIPRCPHCEVESFCYCQCGSIFCVEASGTVTCPWCAYSGSVDFRGGFDVARALG